MRIIKCHDAADLILTKIVRFDPEIMSDQTLNSALIAIISLVAAALVYKLLFTQKAGNLPPHVPHLVPFIGKSLANHPGNAVSFGMDPVAFLQDCQRKYGDTFTFTMVGREMTFCLGEAGNHFVFNARLHDATAEGAYVKLTRPVFGDQVVYDVPNPVFMEQKKVFLH